MSGTVTQPEPTLRSDSAQNLSDFVSRSTLEAYATADLIEQVTIRDSSAADYPRSQLADRLRMIAQLIKADFHTPVYYAMQGGYDTHAAQLPSHTRLLRELSGGLKSFLDDLKAARLDDRVLVLCFSEFGRRAEENASFGTDHGTAGPVFLAGSAVTPGLIGPTPSMTNLVDGDISSSVDFRQVYASLLQNWLDLPSESALGGTFEPLPLLA